MSFFKTSSSRHGLGQIVHLANKDLIIISVVIRIKWTEEKIADWLNHQNDFKTHLLNINCRSTYTNGQNIFNEASFTRWHAIVVFYYTRVYDVDAVQ